MVALGREHGFFSSGSLVHRQTRRLTGGISPVVLPTEKLVIISQFNVVLCVVTSEAEGRASLS